jgi:diguanylate cyclase (GGDEF)-like protein/PAS domain S-box-containing protein
MRDKRSLIYVLMVSMLTMISLPIIILGGIFVFGDYYFFHRDRLELKGSYIREQEHIFQHEVDQAVDHLEWRLSSQKVPENQLKKEIMEWFSTIQFENKGKHIGLLFVGTYDGLYLLEETRKANADSDAHPTSNPIGIEAHAAFLKAAQKPKGGFVDYSQIDPVTGHMVYKKAFVRGVPHFEWYVGSGFYYDDIDLIISQKKTELKDQIQQHVTTVVLVLVAMILIQYLIYRVMIRKIIAGFTSFSEFFKLAEKKNTTVKKRSLHFLEFIELAKSADKMIYERNRAENALRDSESRYRSIIENIEEGYCEIDLEGNIIFANEAMQEILGYTTEEIMTISTKKFLAEEDAERVVQYLANVFVSEKMPSEYVFPIVRKDGVKKYIEISPGIIKGAEGKKIGLRSIVRDVDKRKKYEENLIYLAYHDALTGLKNRKAFYEQLQNSIFRAKRYGTEIGLIYIDIDQFKRVNDTLGHEIGDMLLQEIKNRLEGCLRKTDFISRIGGDEFVIIVDDPTKIHPEIIAQKVVDDLSKPYELNGHVIEYVSSSVGISTFPRDAEDMENLIKKADRAMYKAKEKRNSFFNYSKLVL